MEKYFQNLKEFKKNLKEVELPEEVENEILTLFGKESMKYFLMKEFLKKDDKEILEGLKGLAEFL